MKFSHIFLIIIFFSVTRFQCKKGPPCFTDRFEKGSSIDLLPYAQTYSVGDSIRINKEILYSFISSATIPSINPKLDQSSIILKILELIPPSGTTNVKFATDKFDLIASTGTLYIHKGKEEMFSLLLSNDSVQNKFIGSMVIVPKQSGVFALMGSSRVDYPSCNGEYYLFLNDSWNVVSRNQDIASSFLFYGTTIKYTGANFDGNHPSIFYFKVQ